MELLKDNMPYLIGFAVIFAVIVQIIFNVITYYKYKKINQLDEYLKDNPTCKTEQGIKCKYCGSKSIRNYGFRTADDKKRVHICNSCGKTLYRSKMEFFQQDKTEE